jgi:hypothetical protein
VRLVHWNAAEGTACARRLVALGYGVDAGPVAGTAGLRELRQRPPDAFVIDLSRVPSAGRDVALALRGSPATRPVPLVFVGGEAGKVEGVRKRLPDATFTSWEKIGRDLARALTHPPTTPVAPASVLAGYSGRPLAKKLGIRKDTTVALLGAPEGFPATLGELPSGVRLVTRLGQECDLALWFCRTNAALERGIAGVVSRLGAASVWIAWPKRGSPLAADISERTVRAAGLAASLVDYKICAIDAIWSGLLFTRRQPKR